MCVIIDAAHERDHDGHHQLLPHILLAVETWWQNSFVIVVQEGYLSEAKLRELQRYDSVEVIIAPSRVHGTASLREIHCDRDSTIYHAVQRLAKTRERAAFISSGNTAALAYHAQHSLQSKSGIAPPPLAAWVPTLGKEVANRKQALLVDAGAVVHPGMDDLVRFAKLGRRYYRNMCGKNAPIPTVALLNNGVEEWKGDELHRATFKELRRLFGDHFIGNLEADKLLDSPADVIVADGMTGNVALKAAEGAAKICGVLMREEVYRQPKVLRPIHGLSARTLSKPIKSSLNPDEQGGAVFLGLPGDALIVKIHGSSGGEAIGSAVRNSLNTLLNGHHIS